MPATATRPKSNGKASPKAAAKTAPAPKAAPDVRAVANLLKMAADPTRLLVLAHLAAVGQAHVTDLCAATEIMSQPAVSHHLALLRLAGMVMPRRMGKNNFYSLTAKGATLAKVVEGLTGE